MEKKLDRKLAAYLKKYSDGVMESKRSNYYQFGVHIIRVSDHIGKNSDGHFSIIIDRNNNYMIHDHHTNGITVANYDKIKSLIRTMSIRRDLGLSIETAHDMKLTQEVCKTVSGYMHHHLCTQVSVLKAHVAQLQKANHGLRMNFNKYQK
jgi:hypothetical protein